jgi:hypothetical protein
VGTPNNSSSMKIMVGSAAPGGMGSVVVAHLLHHDQFAVNRATAILF